MPKRKSDEELLKLYKSKIKKIKNKNKISVRRRVIVYSDSESDIENNQEFETIQDESMTMNPYCHDEPLGVVETDPIQSLLPTDIVPNVNTPANENVEPATFPDASQNIQTPEESTTLASELEPEIKLALGDPGDEVPIYGENIHADLAQRWLPVLRKGLVKEVKDTILKEYNVPDNCRLLKAPSLNPEIAAAIPDVVRSRDKKMEGIQGQLGLGITAISRAMSMVLSDGKKVEVIKLLSDGCRILTDLHHIETQTRTKLITPCLDKSFLNIIQGEERDDTLFGNNISEKIKAAKAIEKQGLQIKRNAPSTSKVTIHQQTSIRPRSAGNWSAPPRYPSSMSRGGRGGMYSAIRAGPGYSYRRAHHQIPLPASNLIAAPLQNRHPPSRQRAPTRQ